MLSISFAFKGLLALRKSIHKQRSRNLLIAFIALKLSLVSVSLLASETNVFEALSEAESASNPVSKASSSFETPAVATAKPMQSAAAQVKDERLQILQSERESLQKKIDSADTDQKNRLKADLAALDREIDLVSKSKPYQISKNAGAASNASPAKKKPVETGATPPRQFESWDIFRNFGKKEE